MRTVSSGELEEAVMKFSVMLTAVLVPYLSVRIVNESLSILLYNVRLSH